MINPKIRERIRQLRSTGRTYTEICNVIGQDIPKGTMSYICKDIVLSTESSARHKVYVLKLLEGARASALDANKRILDARFQAILDTANKVIEIECVQNSEKIYLAMLYLGEGSKYKSYRGLALGSSDAAILKLYICLLERRYDKKRSDFHARVQCRADQDISALRSYWSSELGILESAFYQSSPDKRTIGKATVNPDYKGVCVISCSSTDIQLELDSIARLYQQKIWGVSSFG